MTDLYRIEEAFTREDEASRQAFDSTNKMFPKFSDEQVEQATRMEVWGSTFTNPEPDHCEFRLLNDKNEIICKRRVEGY